MGIRAISQFVAASVSSRSDPEDPCGNGRPKFPPKPGPGPWPPVLTQQINPDVWNGIQQSLGALNQVR